jgi:putative transposase
MKQRQLLVDIRQVYTQRQGRYDSPHIADELRERGMKASRNRVPRLMHQAVIRSISDITYIPSEEGRLYLTKVLDLADQFKGLPVVQSMSRRGNCWDDAVAESFFKTFKCELVNHVDFQTRAEARLATFEYIERGRPAVWYNRRRRHSRLNYQTPTQQESYFYTAPMTA